MKVVSTCSSCVKQTVNGVCKVCKLWEGDETVKVVTKCDTCGVYICKECESNKLKRCYAAIKNKFV